MKPLRIRIDRIVDFGTVVSLVGVDTSTDLPVTIHVEVYNPAMRLYERLGFRPIEDRGPYRLMEWKTPGLS